MENLKTITNFSINTLHEIYQSEETVPDGDAFKKDLIKCKTYIIKSVFPLIDGENICVFNNNTLKIMKLINFNTMMYNRFPCKELQTWFKTSPEITYFKLHSTKTDIVADYKKGILFNCPKIKAEYKEYNTFTDEAKNKCKMILDHILHINCGGNKSQYTYLLYIIKRMALAEKNNIAVLIKTYAQGCGKSTFLKFLEQYVIGEQSTCIGTTKMVMSGFNFPMFNKILIKFEELPCFTREQYKGISGNFKTWITEDFINYEDKNKSSFNSFNCHTMFVLSNNDCIDDDDGRRWLILDQATDYFQNDDDKKKYFKQLYGSAFDQETGNCFYSYLIDNVTVPEKFDPSSDMPLTNNKKSSLAQKIAKPFVFLKEHYVLREVDINKKMKDLYDEYINTRKYYSMTIETFNKHISESELKKYINVVGGYKKLKIKCSELKAIYEKNNWIGEFDEYEKNNNDTEEETNSKPRNYFNDNDDEVEKLKQEVERLNKIIESLKNEKDESLNEKIFVEIQGSQKKENSEKFLFASHEDEDNEVVEEVPKKKKENPLKKEKKSKKKDKVIEDNVFDALLNDSITDLF